MGARRLPVTEVWLLHELFHNPLRVPQEAEMLSASLEGHTRHRRSISQTCASLALFITLIHVDKAQDHH